MAQARFDPDNPAASVLPEQGEPLAEPQRESATLPDEEVFAAAQRFGMSALGEELTGEQEDIFAEVYRRLERRVLEANRGD